MKLYQYSAAVVLCVFLLSACGDIKTDPTYSNKTREELYKNGSLVSEKGGWSLLGGDERKASPSNVGIGVNGYLWRAALDTISFMPIASADPFGGVIITDWYSPSDSPTERIKLNIFIRDRELTANGVKVSVFRQSRDSKGGWIDDTVSPSTATSVESSILFRARQLKMAKNLKK